MGGVNDSPVAVIHRACVMRRDFVTAPGPRWKSAHFRLITDKASKEPDIFAGLGKCRSDRFAIAIAFHSLRNVGYLN